MRSLRTKITAVTTAAILISAVALGCAGIFILKSESDRNSTQEMSLMCENTQMLLDGYLNSLKQSVDMAVYIADDSLETMDPTLFDRTEPSKEKVSQLDDYWLGHAYIRRDRYYVYECRYKTAG